MSVAKWVGCVLVLWLTSNSRYPWLAPLALALCCALVFVHVKNGAPVVTRSAASRLEGVDK